MRKIVFSEGRNDVRFACKFFNNNAQNPTIDTFVAEEFHHDVWRREEDEKIRSFLERWSPYDVLLKSENGKENLKEIFVSLSGRLATEDVEKYLLVDLDGTEVDALVSELDERMRQRFEGHGLRIADVETVARNSYIVATEAGLQADAGPTPRTGFTVVAFRSSLESVADVTGDEEYERRLSKIESVLDRRPVDRLLRRVLL